jgi:hypothetical protein
MLILLSILFTTNTHILVMKLELMKITVFWDGAPCSRAEIDRRFGVAYFLLENLIMEALSTYKSWPILRGYTAHHPRSSSSSYSQP